MSISQNAFIHKTSIIEDGATIKDGCYIGPFCCVGQNVVLEENVTLQSHVVVMEDTTIGEGSVVYPFASLGQKPQDLKYHGERARLEIGKKTTIREYVTANIGTEGGGMLTKVGDNCLIMAYCHIAHDCIIGNNVILVNGVNLSGHVIIEDNAIIGGMSAVKQFSRIGKNAMIGGATGIDRDIIPYGIARSERDTTLKGLNIIGMKRHGFSNDEIFEMMEAYKEIFVYSQDKTQFTENLKLIRSKYSNNENVQYIIDFIEKQSKNPICTTVPTDC